MSRGMRRTIILGLATVGFVGLAVPQALPPIIIEQTLTQSFGMVGLTAGQTAQLNVWNAYESTQLTPGAVCTAQVTFVDNTGNVLKSGTISVAPGSSASFDLNRDTDLPSETALRLQIRAAFSTSLPRAVPVLTPIVNPGLTPSPTPTPTPSPSPSPVSTPAVILPFEPACNLFPTLEVIDNASGKTLVVLETTRSVESNLVPPPVATPLVPTPTTGGN